MEQVVSSSGIWNPLLSLMLTSAVVMGSPGPATMSVTAVGAAFGLRGSLPYLTGIVLGTTAVLFAVSAGLISTLMSVPQLAPALLAVSVAYIGYLALKIAMAPPLSARNREDRAPSFAGGFLLAISNPKAYLAIAAVFAGTTIGAGSPTEEAVLKISVLTAMIIAIHLVWFLAGTSLSRLLYHPTSSRLVNLLFASILVVTTVAAILPSEVP